jgi:hypothetical protein
MRRRKESMLSVDRNDPRTWGGFTEKDLENGLRTPEDCFKAWRNHFESEEKREAQLTNHDALSAYYFHWAGDADIKRPTTDVKFDCLNGILLTYQYFVLREGEVLMRAHSCWCLACLQSAMAGPGGDTTLTSNYTVPNCSRFHEQLYQWHNASCRAIAGSEVGCPDKRAREHGHSIAKGGLVPGQWILAEAYNDKEDELWLGKTVPLPGSRSCCKQHEGPQKRIDHARFDEGDFMVGVQWYERVPDADDERRVFVCGEEHSCIMNSTELRLAGFEVPRIVEADADVEIQATEFEKTTHWQLLRKDEAKALLCCR